MTLNDCVAVAMEFEATTVTFTLPYSVIVWLKLKNCVPFPVKLQFITVEPKTHVKCKFDPEATVALKFVGFLYSTNLSYST